MTQEQQAALKQQATILESIQSEVSAETSPLLDFLIRHSKWIFGGLITLIALIIAVGAWNYYSGKQVKNAEEALGKIIVMKENSDKLAALQSYLESADKNMKNPALFALMNSATKQGDTEKAIQAWHEIAASNDGAIKTIAVIAEARNLADSGKHDDAIRLLESLLPNATTDMSVVANGLIVELAEAAQNWDRAIAASQAIMYIPGVMLDTAPWQQRIAYFQSKKQ